MTKGHSPSVNTPVSYLERSASNRVGPAVARLFMGFPNPLRRMPGEDLKLEYDHSFHNLFNLLLLNQPVI